MTLRNVNRPLKADPPPDRWLQGRSLAHETAGLTPRRAVAAAVEDWYEQMMLSDAHRAQREAQVG